MEGRLGSFKSPYNLHLTLCLLLVDLNVLLVTARAPAWLPAAMLLAKMGMELSPLKLRTSSKLCLKLPCSWCLITARVTKTEVFLKMMLLIIFTLLSSAIGLKFQGLILTAVWKQGRR